MTPKYNDIVFTLDQVMYYGILILLLITFLEILIFKVYYREKIKIKENQLKEYTELKSGMPVTEREIILRIDELAKIHKRTREQEIEWALEQYIKENNIKKDNS